MVLRLFKPDRRPQPAHAQVPAARRIYVIGDIHGRADLLADLHRRILEDAAEHRSAGKDEPGHGRAAHVAVYLGDYVDRGLESRQVIDMLLGRPLPGFQTVYLLGNHEQAMLDFQEDPAIGPAWMQYGGAATLFSYGINVQARLPAGVERLAHLSAELKRALPPRHLAFLRSLALMHEEGDYLFVHAGIRPGVPLDRQDRDDLIQIRDEFLGSDLNHGKIIVHGHTITERPEVRHNRIGIDTGAFATGRLTCLVLEGTSRALLQT